MAANKSHTRGRNKKEPNNQRYIAEKRQEKSHIRRIAAHLKRYGEGDLVAVKALQAYKVQAGVR
jgi:hypothetical protein